jgi:hypothetical protein
MPPIFPFTFSNLGILPFDISSVVNRPVLYIVLLLFFAGYAIISGVLFYHWKSYGMGNPSVRIAKVLFSFVSILLFCAAFLSISYF